MRSKFKASIKSLSNYYLAKHIYEHMWYDYYETDCWIFYEKRAACGNHL